MDYIKPNIDELRELVRACRVHGTRLRDSSNDIEGSNPIDAILSTPADQPLSIDDISVLAVALTDYMDVGTHILVSMGETGLLWCRHYVSFEVDHFPALDIANPDGKTLVTNGAGDAFSGGFVAGLCKGDRGISYIDENGSLHYVSAIQCGLEAARRRIMYNSGL